MEDRTTNRTGRIILHKDEFLSLSPLFLLFSVNSFTLPYIKGEYFFSTIIIRRLFVSNLYLIDFSRMLSNQIIQMKCLQIVCDCIRRSGSSGVFYIFIFCSFVLFLPTNRDYRLSKRKHRNRNHSSPSISSYFLLYFDVAMFDIFVSLGSVFHESALILTL